MDGSTLEINSTTKHKNDVFLGAVTGTIKNILRIEATVVLIAAVFFYKNIGGDWGKFFLLFLIPDVSMLGYLVNRQIGALCYNIGHSYVSPAIFFVITELSSTHEMLGPVLIWVAHIGFDRLVGYGLKYHTAFGDTHLGRRGWKSDHYNNNDSK